MANTIHVLLLFFPCYFFYVFKIANALNVINQQHIETKPMKCSNLTQCSLEFCGIYKFNVHNKIGLNLDKNEK